MDNYKKQIATRAILARKDFNVVSNTNVSIFEMLKNQKNFTLILIPLADEISGFSYKHKEHYAIVINSNRDENMWDFICAYELYYLLCEYQDDKYVESENSEINADIFASYFLISEDALTLYLEKEGMSTRKLSIKDIVEIENYFKASRSAVLFRLKDRSLITEKESDEYGKNIQEKVEKDKAHKDYYETFGEYKELAKKLLKNKKISSGKYQEYMIDASDFKEAFKMGDC